MDVQDLDEVSSFLVGLVGNAHATGHLVEHWGALHDLSIIALLVPLHDHFDRDKLLGILVVKLAHRELLANCISWAHGLVDVDVAALSGHSFLLSDGGDVVLAGSLDSLVVKANETAGRAVLEVLDQIFGRLSLAHRVAVLDLIDNANERLGIGTAQVDSVVDVFLELIFVVLEHRLGQVCRSKLLSERHLFS